MWNAECGIGDNGCPMSYFYSAFRIRHSAFVAFRIDERESLWLKEGPSRVFAAFWGGKTEMVRHSERRWWLASPVVATTSPFVVWSAAKSARPGPGAQAWVNAQRSTLTKTR